MTGSVAATITMAVLRARPQSTTVTFEVTGSTDKEMTISWRVPGSVYGKVTEKDLTVSRLPWSATVHVPSREGVLWLDAHVPYLGPPPADATLNCRIAVDGHVVDTGQIEQSLWDVQCRTTLQQVFNPPPAHA